MKLLLIVMSVLFLAGTASAETMSTSKEDAIRAQEQIWVTSLLAADLDTVADLMHRDFRLVRSYSDDPPISREDYLAMRGMSAFSAEVTSVSIKEEVGPVVVARVTWTMDWEQEGVGKLPPHFDMIDTWIQGEDDVWRILSRVSQIAKGPYRTPNGE